MARVIVDVKGLTELPLTVKQIYCKVHDPRNPLPHKKVGKRLWFDMDKVYRWFDSQPGIDHTIPVLIPTVRTPRPPTR
jgi:hypothetical protein